MVFEKRYEVGLGFTFKPAYTNQAMFKVFVFGQNSFAILRLSLKAVRS